MADIFANVPLDALALLDTEVTPLTHSLTTKTSYADLMKFKNVTTYSQLTVLHRCPRKFQLDKEEAFRKVSLNMCGEDIIENVDFAFGHAVGAGVQNFLTTGSMIEAQFACFMAWNIEFEAALERSKKTIWYASYAVEKFAAFYINSELEDWELAYAADGSPGIEIAYELDTQNGFKHYGHIDLIMKHKRSGRIAIFECKTHGFKQAEEAIYGNSTQALGYSVALDTMFPGLTHYEVFYVCYSGPEEVWEVLPFGHTVSTKTEYLTDLVCDHSHIQQYQEQGMFPKRGESCYDFRRRCRYYGECNMVAGYDLPILPDGEKAEKVNYEFTLEKVIQIQLVEGN